MRELIVRDDRELRRIEHTISTIEEASGTAKMSCHCPLAALYAERDELLRACGRRPAGKASLKAA